jgi:hypothetical protein
MIRETNGPTFVRHGALVLAAAVLMAVPTTALAQSATSVPEPERIAATHAFEPGAGMEWRLEPLMFRDSIAAIRRQSNFGSTLPQELVEFRPGANGEWAIAGTIDIPGLNLASVRAISANGFDTLAAAQTDGLVVVARKRAAFTAFAERHARARRRPRRTCFPKIQMSGFFSRVPPGVDLSSEVTT